MQAIKLTDFKIDGFAASNARQGEVAQVAIRAALTSDQPLFHIYMKSIWAIISARTQASKIHISLNRVSTFLLVIHDDASADLYLNDIPIVMEVFAKKDVAAGQAVFLSDLADVRHMRIEGIEFKPTNKTIFCFKVGWKFALLFDLGRDRELDIRGMEQTCGHLYRILTFEEVYQALGDESLLQKLTASGWFPFIGIIGGDFDDLLKAYRNDFSIEAQEMQLLAKFDASRVDAVTSRWWKNPILSSRRAILEPALNAFKQNDPVSCLKNLLTEMEGVLRDARIVDMGAAAKIDKLLEYAADKGIQKSGSEDSLFFPKQFLRYLKDHTYATFDPLNTAGTIASRHSVGHGGAPSSVYTQVRALQAILTLDQIVFYL